MRTFLVIGTATLLGVLAAAAGGSEMSPAADGAQPAQAPATGDPVRIKVVLRASNRRAVARAQIKARVTPPDASWTVTAVDGGSAIEVTHSAPCPATARIAPGLALRPSGEPTGVRGRMVTTRFSTARAESTVVGFFDGVNNGELIVGRRERSGAIAGRIATSGGFALAPGARPTGFKSSVELRLAGRFGRGCQADARDRVLGALGVMLRDGLHFRNLRP